jgi:hypothetical protein
MNRKKNYACEKNYVNQSKWASWKFMWFYLRILYVFKCSCIATCGTIKIWDINLCDRHLLYGLLCVLWWLCAHASIICYNMAWVGVVDEHMYMYVCGICENVEHTCTCRFVAVHPFWHSDSAGYAKMTLTDYIIPCACVEGKYTYTCIPYMLKYNQYCGGSWPHECMQCSAGVYR